VGDPVVHQEYELPVIRPLVIVQALDGSRASALPTAANEHGVPRSAVDDR